jgi:hypothetical protein
MPLFAHTDCDRDRSSADCPFQAGRARPGAAQNDASASSQPQHITGDLCVERHERIYRYVSPALGMDARGSVLPIGDGADPGRADAARPYPVTTFCS